MNVISVKRIHQSDWSTEGVRFLRARDIVADYKHEEVEDLLYISQEKYEECSALVGKVAIDDMLVTGVGTIGIPYLIKDLTPLYFKDGNIIWFQNNGKIQGDFFYYSFTAAQIQNFIKDSAGIGTVGTYTIESGKKTPILLPSEAEQNKIGQFFKDLDNLITLHQSKSFWYILKSIVSCTLYWEQCKLGEMCQITMGQSPDGSTYSETPSDFILVQGNADLKDGWIFPRIWTTQKIKTADAGDLIMSVRAPAGAMGKTAYNVVLGRGVAGIKGNEFIYQSLVKMDSDGYWKKLAAGSTFESINSDVVNGAELIIPQDIEEQIQIGSFFANLDNLITLHQLEPYNLIFKAIAYRIIDYAKSKPPKCIK